MLIVPFGESTFCKKMFISGFSQKGEIFTQKALTADKTWVYAHEFQRPIIPMNAAGAKTQNITPK